MDGFPQAVADADCCYLTTVGRTTGRDHEVEIWFGVQGAVLYVIGGHDETDWLRNLRAQPQVEVRVGDERHHGVARVVEDPAERHAVGRLLADKYERSLSPEDVFDGPRSWAFGATAVAIEGWR
jgi:deazaflavin-dependent oxidoreductase (nitroreductase family)